MGRPGQSGEGLNAKLPSCPLLLGYREIMKVTEQESYKVTPGTKGGHSEGSTKNELISHCLWMPLPFPCMRIFSLFFLISLLPFQVLGQTVFNSMVSLIFWGQKFVLLDYILLYRKQTQPFNYGLNWWMHNAYNLIPHFPFSIAYFFIMYSWGYTLLCLDT